MYFKAFGFFVKTAGYYFVKGVFEKDESLFSQKNYFLHQILNFLIFFAIKNIKFAVEKTILRNNIIRYAFYCNFATFIDLDKSQVFLQ